MIKRRKGTAASRVAGRMSKRRAFCGILQRGRIPYGRHRGGRLPGRLDSGSVAGRQRDVVELFPGIEGLWETRGRDGDLLLIDVPIGLSEHEPAVLSVKSHCKRAVD
jgi:hypothetical protein